MSSRDTLEFLALSAIWGASFLFMRVAAPEFGPVSLMLVRCAIGALTLLPVLLWHRKGGDLIANAGTLLLVGVLNSAIPFVLLGYATLALTAGVTSILNALAPLWTAVVAWLWLGDRLTRDQMIGLGLGAVGVSVLVAGGSGGSDAGGGLNASGEGSAVSGVLWSLLPYAAGVLAAVFYGVAANLARRRLVGVHPLATATGSQLSATAVLFIPGFLTWPSLAPSSASEGVTATVIDAGAKAGWLGVSGTSWLSAIALGVVCTGLAYLLFYRLIASIGATRTVAVTFVIPLFGVGWGALFLSERIDLATLIGGAVIVLGTALTTGVLSLTRRGASD